MLGSRDVIREAFGASLLSDGPVWTEMVRDSNLTSYVYNRSTAEAITGNISIEQVWLYGSRQMGRERRGKK